jgi:hypothetical protein
MGIPFATRPLFALRACWSLVKESLAATSNRGQMSITSLPFRYHSVDLDLDEHFRVDWFAVQQCIGGANVGENAAVGYRLRVLDIAHEDAGTNELGPRSPDRWVGAHRGAPPH